MGPKSRRHHCPEPLTPLGPDWRTGRFRCSPHVHFKVSEVYHVMKGSGTLVTGGTVLNPKTRAADSIEVTREEIGRAHV